MLLQSRLCELYSDLFSSGPKRKTRTDQVNARFHCSELGSTKNLLTLGCSHRSSSLEAFPAKYRSPLCGPEGNRGFLSALRACGLRFGSRLGGSATPSALGALCLKALHRFGSFLNPLSAKNICSPAVNTNSAPHSEHFRTLSWNSMSTPPETPFGQGERVGLPPWAFGCT